MAYTIHNFQPNAVLLASQLNEMDAQIATNESSASNAVTIATNAGNSIASMIPNFSNASTYAVGDLAMYEAVLYRCTTAIVTPESWTAAHWTATTLNDEIGDVDGVVKYSEAQTLTTAEQTQARTNINAASMDDITASMKFLTYVLSSGSWNSDKEQTATVTGVLPDGYSQLITVSPQASSEDAYIASGILCVGQSANALTFKATIVPTTDISVSISMANGVSAI